MSDARDNQLRDAFQVVPFTLAPLKVRFDHDVDATAGEIKYHKSCWTKSIIRVMRGFEGEVSQENQNKLVVPHIFHDPMDLAIKQLTLGSVLTITMIASAFERHFAAARLNDYILSRR